MLSYPCMAEKTSSTLLRTFLNVQDCFLGIFDYSTKAHLFVETLMLDEKLWITISAQIYSEEVLSVQHKLNQPSLYEPCFLHLCAAMM